MKYYPLREVALMILGVTAVIGSFLALMNPHRWYMQYLFTAVTSISCSIFIGVPLSLLYGRLRALPQALFLALFAALVAAGALLGAETAHLAIEGALSTDRRILIFTLIVSLVMTSAIVAYRRIRLRLEENIARAEAVERENEVLRRYELEARLGSLQAKLNPHFLFNTLNSLAALVYDDPTRAEQTIIRLSDLYRRVLSASESGFVTIADELALVADYIELERQRFEERLSFRVSCPPALADARIPGLIIEPLVENAIKHNGAAKKLSIEVEISEMDGAIAISVRDDGNGFDPAGVQFGFGLGSVQRRLSLLFAPPYGLSIDSSPGAGARVSIRIPRSRAPESSAARGACLRGKDVAL